MSVRCPLYADVYKSISFYQMIPMVILSPSFFFAWDFHPPPIKRPGPNSQTRNNNDYDYEHWCWPLHDILILRGTSTWLPLLIFLWCGPCLHQVLASLAPPSADPLGFWSDCRSNHANCNSSQIQFLQGVYQSLLLWIMHRNLCTYPKTLWFSYNEWYIN